MHRPASAAAAPPVAIADAQQRPLGAQDEADSKV